ncbi:MAG: glycoside hydrolase family 88 protein [Bacteroidia bacterium]|nr:glycoside hydrolase family 88 protein [Bacteroidia bacterium]
MKKYITCVSSLLVILLWSGGVFAQPQRTAQTKAVMEKVADWQIKHFQDLYSSYIQAHHPLSWHNAALYVGMSKWAELSEDDRFYTWLRRIGKAHDWKLHSRMYHADDHAVGQMYLALYDKFGDEKMIRHLKDQFDYILMHPAQSSLSWGSPFHQDRWNWCDALFMSPPVWAKLYQKTGEQKYLDFLMKEYKATSDFLRDEKLGMYYRDERFKLPNERGHKVFWARGNGWVFAGLANILQTLEKDTEAYAYFLEIYLKMTETLRDLQTKEGYWAMSLMEAEEYPTPETSGTSFFTFGLAWGINEGILDRTKFEPVVLRSWNCLLSHVSAEGKLGYVQPVGAAPGQAWPDRTEVYGSGAFLAAGTEMYRFFKEKESQEIKPKADQSKLYAQLESLNWKEGFSDDFHHSWKKNWALDGAYASVKNIDNALEFWAGPARKVNAHHAVLWTKKSFEGDIKIEYTYTKLDDRKEAVNILYIQATGSGEEGYEADIFKWSDKRVVPTMSTYFRNMNTLHISYAAYGIDMNKNAADYIRARRYVPESGRLIGTDIEPSYFNTGLFEQGVAYNITVIKKGKDLFMYIRNDENNFLFHWTLNESQMVKEGRIGLRHMWTRGSRYEDFKVSILD